MLADHDRPQGAANTTGSTGGAWRLIHQKLGEVETELGFEGGDEREFLRIAPEVL